MSTNVVIRKACHRMMSARGETETLEGLKIVLCFFRNLVYLIIYCLIHISVTATFLAFATDADSV